MRPHLFRGLLLCASGLILAPAISLAQSVVAAPPAHPVLTGPPIAPVRVVVDDYYGNKIEDPYRYMEDLQNSEVQAWFKGQND